MLVKAQKRSGKDTPVPCLSSSWRGKIIWDPPFQVIHDVKHVKSKYSYHTKKAKLKEKDDHLFLVPLPLPLHASLKRCFPLIIKMSISPGSQAPQVESPKRHGRNLPLFRLKEPAVVLTAPWAAPNEDLQHIGGTHMST